MSAKRLSFPRCLPLPSLQQRSAYWRLMRADRPIGTLLLLWPTWCALWLAQRGLPSFKLLLVFTLGVWVTRSAGCIVNDYADRWLDPYVRRTQSRPLASGELTSRQAIGLFAVCIVFALGLVLTLNVFTRCLSGVAVLLMTTYPYLKRVSHLPQVYLGFAFGWGIPMAFAAVTNTLPTQAWIFFLANLCWTTAYDTWYAMVDREDDRRVGGKSTAILFGKADTFAIAVLYCATCALLLDLGLYLSLGIAYWLGCLGAFVLTVRLYRAAMNRTRESCFTAFIRHQWVGAIFFAGIALEPYVRF